MNRKVTNVYLSRVHSISKPKQFVFHDVAGDIEINTTEVFGFKVPGVTINAVGMEFIVSFVRLKGNTFVSANQFMTHDEWEGDKLRRYVIELEDGVELKTHAPLAAKFGAI